MDIIPLNAYQELLTYDNKHTLIMSLLESHFKHATFPSTIDLSQTASAHIIIDEDTLPSFPMVSFSPEDFSENEEDWKTYLVEYNVHQRIDNDYTYPDTYKILPIEHYAECVYGFYVKEWESGNVILPVVLLSNDQIVPNPTYLSLWNFYEFECSLQIYKNYIGEHTFLFSHNHIAHFNQEESANCSLVNKTMRNIALYFKLENHFDATYSVKKPKI